MIRCLPALLSTALVLAQLAAHYQPTPATPTDSPVTAFTGNDLFKPEAARDPQVSPDGLQIAFFNGVPTAQVKVSEPSDDGIAARPS